MSHPRSPAVVWIAVVAAMAGGGCGDPLPTEQATPLTLLTAAVVSDPVSAPANTGIALSGAAGGTVVYVSLPPGRIPFSVEATIRNPRTGATLTVPMVDGGFDPVAVEANAGVFGGASPIPGAKVTVRNNTFPFPGAGGFLAVFGSGAGAMMDVVANQATGPTRWGAFQLQNGASGRIENNTATLCGRVGCISAIGGPGAIVVGNTVSSAPGMATQPGIRVRSDNAVVTGNIVSGGSIRGDEPLATDYGYSFGGIQIGAGTSIVVNGNTISGAMLGLEGNASLQSARDNVITGVLTAFSGTFGPGPLTSNDVTDYVIPFTLPFGSGGLTCNWWGDSGGPRNIPNGADPAIYTP